MSKRVKHQGRWYVLDDGLECQKKAVIEAAKLVRAADKAGNQMGMHVALDAMFSEVDALQEVEGD